jgi:hypothetical protein
MVDRLISKSKFSLERACTSTKGIWSRDFLKVYIRFTLSLSANYYTYCVFSFVHVLSLSEQSVQSIALKKIFWFGKVDGHLFAICARLFVHVPLRLFHMCRSTILGPLFLQLFLARLHR